jgi:tryptophanyl-tRNA synthetase
MGWLEHGWHHEGFNLSSLGRGAFCLYRLSPQARGFFYWEGMYIMPTKSSTLEPAKAGGKTRAATRAQKAEPTTKKPRVFSGIQPTNNPHIGNYLGAMRHWAAEQDHYDSIFCIVNLHAITLPQDPAELRQNTLSLAAMLLAVGIDPARAPLFIQSQVNAHAELTWLLNCVTSLGWLNKMHQFKSKAGEDRESATAGLYDYPVLMAADILLYDAELVPVGDDQRQHIELTRNIVERFNERFGDIFVMPNALIREEGARIMALDDPTRKMSKSEPNGAIFLTDPPSVIKKKIARATTDSERTIEFNPNRPGIYNLATIYGLLAGQDHAMVEEHFAGKGYKEFKAELTDLLVATLAPIQARYSELMNDPAQLAGLLRAGADRVRPQAEATLARAQHAMGIR